MERRLAAILAADVVSYSRLMEADEAGTLEALKAHRAEFIDPEIANHGGRIVKLMGDGALVEFPSVVDAVECAVAVQQGMAERNVEMSTDKRIVFRIGVNLGDIIIEGDDIYGDGVNVAARLETLAEPGGVCISGTVYEHIVGKLDHAFTDAGEQTVKNIARPIRVWHWPGGAPDIAAVHRRDAILPLPDKPSVAILPFTNMSRDPEQEYFSDGITEDIITEVSRFRELFITARNSSFAFKNEQIDLKDLGARLGVRFVVEGSVRRAGNRVRITAQLIEAATGNHVWAERYDRDLADIFEVQDEVARAIATFVAGRVRSNTVELLRRRPTDSLTAYDLYLRAIAYTETYSNPEDFEPLLIKAADLDPNFAAVYAALAITQIFRNLLRYDSSRLPVGVDYARTALNLDPNDSRSHMAMGMCLYTMGRLDEAKVYLDRSIALNPNDAWSHGASGFCLMYLGRLDEALTAIDMALRLDPYGNEWFWDGRGMILMLAHRFEEAIEAYQHMSRPASWSLAYEAICFAELGRMDEARANIAKFRQIAASRTAWEIAHDEPFEDAEIKDWLYDWLVELELPSE